MDPNSVFASVTPELCQTQDRFGNTFYYGDAGDFWYPPFPIGSKTDYKTLLRSLENFEMRPDDVIICSFPKTGLHWTSEIVRMLMTGTSDHEKASAVPEQILGFLPNEMMDQVASPRLVVTHTPFRHLPKQIWEKGVKVVYLVRNPKDVLVSFYNHLKANTQHLSYPGTFEEFATISLESGFYFGHIFDYFMDWQRGMEEHPNASVFVSVYEELKKNPVDHIQRLNEYLETSCSGELCKDIAAACEFKTLKAYKDPNEPAMIKATFKSSDGSFYRKGIAGDWVNWFTPDLSQLYDEQFAKKMSDYKIKFE